MTDLDELKRAAAISAIDAEVRSGMLLGLGTGSTAAFLLDGLAERLSDGRLGDIQACPPLEATADRCRELGIPLAIWPIARCSTWPSTAPTRWPPGLDLIKGLGGAQLREKVIACSAARFVVVCDDRKLVDRLGQKAPLPVEVIDFALPLCQRLLERDGWHWSLRPGLRRQPVRHRRGQPDPRLPPRRLERSHRPGRQRVAAVPGVVAHGFFLGIAASAHVAGAERRLSAHGVTFER